MRKQNVYTTKDNKIKKRLKKVACYFCAAAFVTLLLMPALAFAESDISQFIMLVVVILFTIIIGREFSIINRRKRK